jgi:hypothetical protein
MARSLSWQAMRGRSTAVLASLVLAALPAGTAHAKRTHLKGGTVSIAFAPDFGIKLVGFGVTPGPIAPATQEGLTVSAPIRRSSTVSKDGTRATITTSGGISQQGETLDLKQLRLQYVVKGKRVVVSSDTAIKGVLFDRFDFARGTAKAVKRTKRGYTLTGVALKLNAIGMVTLNSQLRTMSFATGEPIGVATITATR